MSYVLLADSHTYVAEAGMTWPHGLGWARAHGYNTAKARRSDGYVDRPLLPSEQAPLVEEATRPPDHLARERCFEADAVAKMRA